MGGGLAALSAGAVAVFVSNNGTGTAALILSGAASAVLGGIGKIARVKYGEAEAVFGLVEEAVEAEVSGDEETVRVLLDAALRLAASTPKTAPGAETLQRVSLISKTSSTRQQCSRPSAAPFPTRLSTRNPATHR